MANTYVTGVDGFNANTPLYNILVNKLYDWSNRDIQALPPQIARDSLHYSADNAYRVLRIPPLEHTVVYTNTNDALTNASTGLGNIYQSVTAVSVPPDLIEFIHIRGRDENMLTTRVFNEKADVRSYWDFNTNHYNQTAFWSRQGNSVLLTPAFGQVARGFYGGVGGAETEIEMYYYRRLPDLQAQYEVTPANFTNGLLRRYDTTTTVDTGLTDSTTYTIENDVTALRLFFDGASSVTPENFRAGRLTVTQPGLINNGSLYFNPTELVNAENWLTDFRAFTQVEEGQGRPLYFDPIQQEDRFTATEGQTMFTGTVRPEDVTDANNNGLVVQVNNVETTAFMAAIVNDRIRVTLTNPATAGDIVVLDYNEFIANPLQEHIRGRVHDEPGTEMQNRQRIDFIVNTSNNNYLNFIVTSLDVQQNSSGDFTLQVFFEGDPRTDPPVPGTDTAFTTQNEANNRMSYIFVGKEVPNWLKDENEKIVLMGGLGEAFSYLQEDDQSTKYFEFFKQELTDLNDEDRKRDTAGGNIQIQYNARGML